MKFLLPLWRTRAITPVFALLALTAVHAQNEAVKLPPELAPLEEKYQTNLDALERARNTAVAALRQSYLAALAAAGQKAAHDGKKEESKAVTSETEALSGGQELGAKAPLWLPHSLATPRANFLREIARAEHEYTVRAQEASGEYLRGLTFYESKATVAKQTALLAAIEAEKLRLTGKGPANAPSVRGAGQNVVLNGDFAQTKADGMAESWSLGGQSQGAVANDHGISYLHFSNPDAKKEVFFQTVDRPPEAKELVVTVRMRSCPDLQGRGEYGVVVWQLDAQDKQITRDMPVRNTTPAPGWRTYTGTVKLVPEAKKIQFRGIIDNGLTGAVDYGDLRGEAR